VVRVILEAWILTVSCKLSNSRRRLPLRQTLDCMSTELESSEQARPRPLIDFAVSLVIVAIGVFAASAGFHSSACSNGSDGPGWALLWVMVLPFIFPASLLLWPAVSLGLGLWCRPSSSSRRFALFCLASLVAMPILAFAGWSAARLAQATARCSFGF
jgi:hypothetical protein